MKQRIFRRMLALATLVALLTGTAMFALRWRAGLDELAEQTSRQAAIAAAGYLHAADPAVCLDALGQSDLSRVTLIAADGAVLYDSNAPVSQMENHADRPEVREAQRTGNGQAVRISATLQSLTCYSAIRLPGGTVLRVANTTDLLTRSAFETIPAMLAVIIVIFLLSALLADRLTVRLVRPINAIDLQNPLAAVVYDELSPLLHRLDAQNRQIDRQMDELRRKQIEFDAITSGMDEGLIVLDERLTVLTCNRAALRLLAAGETVVGTPLAVFAHEPPIGQAAAQALAGDASVYDFARDGIQLRLSFSPVRVDGGVRGVVLLVLDVSAQFAAEQSRRSFTANVTHELKTPLTSVLGYAEMIRYGLARPEDVPGFAARIHDEAARLLALVDDIMKLSRLDEGRGSLDFEPVELYALCQAAIDRLESKASAQNVTLSLSGAPCTVSGVPVMLDEVVTNLCDNAIKYNRPGGAVRLTLTPTDTGARLTVVDNGPGIAPAAQPHIFERFYRADASRSREVPGTGLGLSIVKHICEIHGASIRFESSPAGTTFTVDLPAFPGDRHG